MVRPYVYKCHIGLCTPRRTLMDSKKKKKRVKQKKAAKVERESTI